MYKIEPYYSCGSITFKLLKYKLYRWVTIAIHEDKEFLVKVVKHLKSGSDYYCSRCSGGCHCGYA